MRIVRLMEPLSYSAVLRSDFYAQGFSPPLYYQSASALLVFSIPADVFWPYFAGAATLVIGLGTSIKNRIGQASGFDKFILFGPLLFAIAMAVFGADHFVTVSFAAKIVPSWIPGRLFWAYRLCSAS